MDTGSDSHTEKTFPNPTGTFAEFTSTDAVTQEAFTNTGRSAEDLIPELEERIIDGDLTAFTKAWPLLKQLGFTEQAVYASLSTEARTRLTGEALEWELEE